MSTHVSSRSYADKKVYYSGKHLLYGQNVELSVLPNGFAIDCTKHYKGSVSDKTIFDENLHFYMASLTKQASEDRMDDPDQATRQWANYDILFETYVAMMNVHIRMRPLRVDDGDVNVQYVNELNAIETKTVKGKKSSAQSSMAAGDAGGSDTNLGSNSENESSSIVLDNFYVVLTSCNGLEIGFNH
ncbi:hypothetical protein AaE_011190 [Aphanomyces astaci]|uniref:DDE Tnp4 domain-containing protein n=1 Tax=Aphanomyces astaci TaxID=112090 RepID=A0A6A4ZU52_APHAT|nr:hypothetical protein AaE_011190 [Aphanomyces astaci]